MNVLPQTSTCFEQISLHDAEIEFVTFGSNRIELHLDSALLGEHHPSNPLGVVAIITGCTLALDGVEEASAQRYDDSLARFVPVADGLQSLARTSVVECAGKPLDGARHEYSFGGFHRPRAEWIEWRVVASAFVLSWGSNLKPWRQT